MVLSNDSIKATIRADNGEFLLTADGLPLVERGYWSQVGRRQDGKDIARLGAATPPIMTIDPADNQGARGEVTIKGASGIGGGKLGWGEV